VTYSRGGIVRGRSPQVWLRPGPAPVGGGDLCSIYEDECILDRRGVCVRDYPGHAALPIPEDRFWSCPAHGDTGRQSDGFQPS
jgi:hypothetical protein